MKDLPDINKLYQEAITICETWRSKTPLATASPNEIALYNVFTTAKHELKIQLACIEDAQKVIRDWGKK